MGWKVEKPSTCGRFLKNLPPIFFICLYFIGMDGDENLKKYLAWPNPVALKMTKNSHFECNRVTLDFKFFS